MAVSFWSICLHALMQEPIKIYIQWNLNSSNTDGSFTIANSNSFLSPNEILPTAQGNKYLRTFSYCTLNIQLLKRFP